MDAKPDARLNAYKKNIADIKLKGKVKSNRFVKGEVMQVVTPFTDVVSHTDVNHANKQGLTTQVLYGHKVKVFETKNGWAWMQTQDGYVGYTKKENLSKKTYVATHKIIAPRTFLYAEPNLKTKRSGYRSIGSLVRVVKTTKNNRTEYAILNTGEAVIKSHLMKIREAPKDYVRVAEGLVNAPYLWGGTTGFGVDCSGLVQLSLGVCNKKIPRDSDMQAEHGKEIKKSEVRRGDLIFWTGHVAIMTNKKNVIHANIRTMNVAVEPLKQVIDRIKPLYGTPTNIRRII